MQDAPHGLSISARNCPTTGFTKNWTRWRRARKILMRSPRSRKCSSATRSIRTGRARPCAITGTRKPPSPSSTSSRWAASSTTTSRLSALPETSSLNSRKTSSPKASGASVRKRKPCLKPSISMMWKTTTGATSGKPSPSPVTVFPYSAGRPRAGRHRKGRHPQGRTAGHGRGLRRYRRKPAEDLP